jgi:hypothetical protein
VGNLLLVEGNFGVCVLLGEDGVDSLGGGAHQLGGSSHSLLDGFIEAAEPPTFLLLHLGRVELLMRILGLFFDSGIFLTTFLVNF